MILSDERNLSFQGFNVANTIPLLGVLPLKLNPPIAKILAISG